jgi:hypothetical protein
MRSIEIHPGLQTRRGLHLVPRVPPGRPARTALTAVVPLERVDEGARIALGTAISCAPRHTLALHVHVDGQGPVDAFTRDWERWDPGVALVLLHDDGRGPTATVADHLEHLVADTVLVVEPWREGEQADPNGTDELTVRLQHLPHVVVSHQQVP